MRKSLRFFHRRTQRTQSNHEKLVYILNFFLYFSSRSFRPRRTSAIFPGRRAVPRAGCFQPWLPARLARAGAQAGQGADGSPARDDSGRPGCRPGIRRVWEIFNFSCLFVATFFRVFRVFRSWNDFSSGVYLVAGCDSEISRRVISEIRTSFALRPSARMVIFTLSS